jgi:Carboxypeptidase regulatory-like domain
MKRILGAFFVSLLVLVMTCGNVWAQATAQISGSVQDPSAAVLPGVGITATQTQTGATRMAITNEAGYYVLPNLTIGP